VFTDGASVGVGHRFSRYISGYLGYGYSANSYDFSQLNTTTTSFINPAFFQDFTKSAVTVSVSWDNTDDFYLPRKGFILSQSFEKAGFGAEANYLKSRTNYNKYYGLEEWVGFDAIFRYKSRFNNVVDNGNIPIAEKFYMGGIGSVRGYEAFSLAPDYIDPGTGLPILYGSGRNAKGGGKMTFSHSAEMSFPLVPKAKMRLVSFIDWGFIGDQSLNEISRGGYGLGLEWFSPVGPIQLMFANPLNQQVGDRTAAFEFTMGQRF
jgi:outer membrane protein insertion porin family